MSVQIDGSTGNIIAIKADYSGDVSIGGTLTYEDVTNIDAVGLITARNGIKVDDLGVQVGTGATIDGATNTLTFLTNGSERVRINSDGLVTVGGNETVSAATGIQIENAGAALLTLLRNDATISDGNTLGGIDFYGNDGGTVQQVAKISAVADGTHGNNDKPTRLIFSTTADGGSSATERLRINSSGNVDINGAPPWTVTGGDYRNLSISGEGASASGFLWLGNGAAATNADFDLGRVNFVNGTNIVAQIKGTTQTSANDDGRISFFTKATGSSIAEALRIDSSGRLLLGTTTEGEGSADNLTIADSGNCGITLRSGTGNSGGIYFSDATSGGGEYDGLIAYHQGNRFLQFWTAQTERMRIDSSGRLLVGSVSALDTTAGAITSNNSSSGGRLALGGNPSSAGSSIGEVFGWWNGNKVAGLVITSGADTTNKDDGELLFYTSASGPNVQERLRIDRVGNVGIGEASPAHELHVSDASTPEIVAEDTSNNCKAYLGSSDTNGRVGTLSNHDFAFRTNDTERMRIDSSGVVKINQSGTGNIFRIQNTTSDESSMLFQNSTTGYSAGNGLYVGIGGDETSYFWAYQNENLNFGTNNTTRMTIFSGGKLRVPGVYNGTTTGGSAVHVESDGDMLRYTSSLKYKTDVETIEDARADAILNCRPVWYRSKCANDIKTEGSEKSDWGWYGFIAEEVAEIEPRLVNWATKDAVRQEDGTVESVERDPANYEAEGVRYDNFVPLLVNLAKRQQSTIEALEARISALEG